MKFVIQSSPPLMFTFVIFGFPQETLWFGGFSVSRQQPVRRVSNQNHFCSVALTEWHMRRIITHSVWQLLCQSLAKDTFHLPQRSHKPVCWVHYCWFKVLVLRFGLRSCNPTNVSCQSSLKNFYDTLAVIEPFIKWLRFLFRGLQTLMTLG